MLDLMKMPKPRLPRWSRLREAGNSSLVQLTVLIPFIGYLIIFNQQIAKYLDLIREVSGSQPRSPELSVSPRLLLIYFGLCLVSFGAIIYRRYCPSEIKRYASSTAFVGGDGPNVGPAGYSAMESEVFRTLPDSHAELADRLNRRSNLAGSKQDADAVRKEFLADIMHLYFDALDESRPWLRAACGGLLTAGAIVLSIPAAFVFFRVLRILVNLVAAYFG